MLLPAGGHRRALTLALLPSMPAPLMPLPRTLANGPGLNFVMFSLRTSLLVDGCEGNWSLGRCNAPVATSSGHGRSTCLCHVVIDLPLALTMGRPSSGVKPCTHGDGYAVSASVSDSGPPLCKSTIWRAGRCARLATSW
jgi:hypothetical protein